MRAGHCRACWQQARLDRSERLGGTVGTYKMLLPDLQRVSWHQLVIADITGFKDLRVPLTTPMRGVGHGSPGISRKVAPAPASQPRPGWLQLVLFDDSGMRVYQRTTIDLRTAPPPDNPWLAWALHLAWTIAETRGWSVTVRSALQRNLVSVLANHCHGDKIRVSHVQPICRDNGRGVRHLVEVLGSMDLLIDDRPNALHDWLDRKLANVAPAIRRDVLAWAHHWLNGGPRSSPRHPNSVRVAVDALIPALTTWSDFRDHLREITREDILNIVTQMHGHKRQTTLHALRTLFRWAKKTKIVFRNPTSQIRGQLVARPVPQPLQATDLEAAINAATTPQARLAVALAAIHAARAKAIRDLRLTDVDLANHRLTINGADRPLDQLTGQVLHCWLDYRRNRWPNTANPHLFISKESALGFGPVSQTWIMNLRGLTATLERLRVDRQLEEALASGGDPLHIANVFGVAESTAVRYAGAARQLLETAIENATQAHREPPDPGKA